MLIESGAKYMYGWMCSGQGLVAGEGSEGVAGHGGGKKRKRRKKRQRAPSDWRECSPRTGYRAVSASPGDIKISRDSEQRRTSA